MQVLTLVIVLVRSRKGRGALQELVRQNAQRVEPLVLVLVAHRLLQ
ncbi:hypothetical protein [Streptomyces sp. NPDC006285]